MIVDVLLWDVWDCVEFVGVLILVMLIVVLCMIIEEICFYDGVELFLVCGLLDDGKYVVFWFGELLMDFGYVLLFVCKGVDKWLDEDFGNMVF